MSPDRRNAREGGRALILLLVVVVAAGIALYASGAFDSAKTPGEMANGEGTNTRAGQADTDGTPRPGVDAKVEAYTPPQVTDPAAQALMLKMPDGTFVEGLNGVEKPQGVRWGRRPYSPIIGKTKRVWGEHGVLDWYVHADGSKTTTYYGSGMRDGKPSKEAVTIVEDPPMKEAVKNRPLLEGK